MSDQDHVAGQIVRLTSDECQMLQILYRLRRPVNFTTDWQEGVGRAHAVCCTLQMRKLTQLQTDADGVETVTLTDLGTSAAEALISKVGVTEGQEKVAVALLRAENA